METQKSVGQNAEEARPAETPNDKVARRLEEAANLLEQQDENPFRIRAYRRAASALRDLDQGLDTVYREGGIDALQDIPGVGPAIVRAIAEILETGHWQYLDTLRGSIEPERLFTSVPGIGPNLSRRIHEKLGVATLEELEMPAADGRLESVPGISRRRAEMVRHALAGMLQRLWPRRTQRRTVQEEPSVEVLLDVDQAYRDKAETDALPKIAPKRFNQSGEAWLPVMHKRRGRWQFTALHSNTARAHELGRERDWVVLYFQNGQGAEGQRTVVTETQGDLAGKRVVRGREPECRRFYSRHERRREET